MTENEQLQREKRLEELRREIQQGLDSDKSTSLDTVAKVSKSNRDSLKSKDWQSKLTGLQQPLGVFRNRFFATLKLQY